jgi:hypothetical protein
MNTPAPVTSRTVTSLAATGFLAGTYGWTLERAARVLAIANTVQPGGKAEPTEGGYVLVTRRGSSFLVEDHTGKDIS